jgi:hypothetical protein
MSHICDLCGNNPTKDKSMCSGCRALVTGPLKEAFGRWTYLCRIDRKCCGQLSHDKTHLYFHGRNWEESYGGTWVEFGVSLYANHMQTYYLRDLPGYADSVNFGPPIPYGPGCMDAVFRQLRKAPEAAWGDDLKSCAECGSHYYEDCDLCGPEELDDNEEEEQ